MHARATIKYRSNGSANVQDCNFVTVPGSNSITLPAPKASNVSSLTLSDRQIVWTSLWFDDAEKLRFRTPVTISLLILWERILIPREFNWVNSYEIGQISHPNCETNKKNGYYLEKKKTWSGSKCFAAIIVLFDDFFIVSLQGTTSGKK